MTDLEIARAARLSPLEDIAAKIGIPRDAIEPFGRHKAKLDLSLIPGDEDQRGKLILVTAISPTLAGEGKSTTSVGLTDALNMIGRKTILLNARQVRVRCGRCSARRKTMRDSL